jgi:potassium transporter
MPKCGQHRLAKEIGRSARRVLINGQKAATVGYSKSDPTPTKGRMGSGSQMTPKPTITQRSTFLKARELRQITRHHRPAIIAVCLFRAALIYGDGAITPSISVLSAVESFNMATPAFKPFVLPRAGRFAYREAAVRHCTDQQNGRDDADRVEWKAGPTRSRCGARHYTGRKRRRSISAAIERVLLSDRSASAASFAYGIASLAVKRSSTTHMSLARPKKLEWQER